MNTKHSNSEPIWKPKVSKFGFQMVESSVFEWSGPFENPTMASLGRFIYENKVRYSSPHSSVKTLIRKPFVLYSDLYLHCYSFVRLCECWRESLGSCSSSNSPAALLKIKFLTFFSPIFPLSWFGRFFWPNKVSFSSNFCPIRQGDPTAINHYLLNKNRTVKNRIARNLIFFN